MDILDPYAAMYDAIEQVAVNYGLLPKDHNGETMALVTTQVMGWFA